MKQLFNAIAVFLSPVIPMLGICFFIILIDTITGRKAARKEKQIISSKKTRLGLVSKLLTYFAVILMAYFTDYYIINVITTHYVWFDYLFTRSWTGVLIWIEWTSINENIKITRGISLNEKAKIFITSLKKVIKEMMAIKQQ